MRLVFFKLVLLLSLISSAPAQAQYVGLSAFAANNPNFPCDRYLQISEASKYPAMAILWGTFGEDYTCLKRFTEKFKDRYHLVQIHFSNETCRPPRANNCGTNDLYPWVDVPNWNRLLEEHEAFTYQAVADRLANIRFVAEAVGNYHTTFLLSTGLEDNYTWPAYVELYQFIRARWPYLMVRNAVGGNDNGKYYLDSFRERHRGGAVCGASVHVVNEDGTADQTTGDSIRFVRKNGGRCLATFVWRPRHQGRSGNFRFLPPEERNFEITDSDLKNLPRVFAAYQ